MMADENTIEKLIRVLESFAYPVKRIAYRPKKDEHIPETYITLRLLQAVPCEYCDDDYERLLYTFSIIITTKKDYVSLLAEIIDLLRSEGYTIAEIESEVIDVETGNFYIPITIKALEE